MSILSEFLKKLWHSEPVENARHKLEAEGRYTLLKSVRGSLAAALDKTNLPAGQIAGILGWFDNEVVPQLIDRI